jgi:hypothetical protein
LTALTGKHDLVREIVDTIIDDGMPTRILHVGDHDPSGVHIGKALHEDIDAFIAALLIREGREPAWGRFERLAVLPEHVTLYKLPTAPAKATDRRSFDGVGDDPTATVQAEALPPDILAAIVEAGIRAEWDDAAETRILRREEEERRRLNAWLAGLDEI